MSILTTFMNLGFILTALFEMLTIKNLIKKENNKYRSTQKVFTIQTFDRIPNAKLTVYFYEVVLLLTLIRSIIPFLMF